MEDTVRQFTQQGYRVVVMGSGAGTEDFKREVAKAMQHDQRTVILVDDTSTLKIEGGRILLIEDAPPQVVTTLAGLGDLKPVHVVSPLRDFDKQERLRARHSENFNKPKYYYNERRLFVFDRK